MIQTYRKRPIEVRAVRFTGTNHADVEALTGTANFAEIAPEYRVDDPDKTAEVYDRTHSVWIPVEPGDWIIRGVQGEHYPCKDSIFTATYEPYEAA